MNYQEACRLQKLYEDTSLAHRAKEQALSEKYPVHNDESRRALADLNSQWRAFFNLEYNPKWIQASKITPEELKPFLAEYYELVKKYHITLEDCGDMCNVHDGPCCAISFLE